MAISLLPQELLNLIIQHLWDHPVTLRTCSLTAHCFLEESQRQFFWQIKLDNEIICSKLLSLLSASAHISSLVRELVLEDGLDDFYFDEKAWIPQSLTLSSILTRLSSLRKLEIYATSLHWPSFSPELASSLLHTFRYPSLVEVTLLGLVNLPEYRNFLSYFGGSAVRSLRLMSVDTGRKTRPVQDTVLPVNTALESLLLRPLFGSTSSMRPADFSDLLCLSNLEIDVSHRHLESEPLSAWIASSLSTVSPEAPLRRTSLSLSISEASLLHFDRDLWNGIEDIFNNSDVVPRRIDVFIVSEGADNLFQSYAARLAASMPILSLQHRLDIHGNVKALLNT